MAAFFKKMDLDEDRVIQIIRTHVESQFPKECSTCGRSFNSLKEYLQNTEHIGQPRSYDAEENSWRPPKPLGTFTFAECKNCGNTLAISSSQMKIMTMWNLLRWAKHETANQGISVSDLLDDLRQKIDNQILSENHI